MCNIAILYFAISVYYKTDRFDGSGRKNEKQKQKFVSTVIKFVRKYSSRRRRYTSNYSGYIVCKDQNGELKINFKTLHLSMYSQYTMHCVFTCI